MQALTAAAATPSARFRVGQFLGPLQEEGVELRWRPAPISMYPPRRRWLRPLWLPATLTARLPALAGTWNADLTLFSRELVSTLSTLEGLSRRPRVLDVDDAVWLRRGGGFARAVAGRMDLVIAGNTYVAEWFGRWCRRVEVLPTAVDLERFAPAPQKAGAAANGNLVVGWTGTSANFPYLAGIAEPLARVMGLFPGLRLKICADRAPRLSGLSPGRVEFVPWSPAVEVAFIQSLDVGLMPLADDAWCRGKCSYKMLQYLACGVPVVVSPVGMNAEVLRLAEVGRGAADAEGWVTGLGDLLTDPAARAGCGKAGRRLVEERFSVGVVAPRLARILKAAAAGAAEVV